MAPRSMDAQVMDEKTPQQELPLVVPEIEAAHVLPIVVGAHLRAEVADRPLAYRLRDAIERWVSERASRLSVRPVPVVCSDVWYVNQQALHRRPTISLGGPGVNALSAYFANRLAAALVQDHKIVIQLDPELVDLRACVWGMNHELTVEALRLFMDRYLDGFLRAAVTQVEPREE